MREVEPRQRRQDRHRAAPVGLVDEPKGHDGGRDAGRRRDHGRAEPRPRRGRGRRGRRPTRHAPAWPACSATARNARAASTASAGASSCVTVRSVGRPASHRRNAPCSAASVTSAPRPPTVALPSSTAKRNRPDRAPSAGSAHNRRSSAATTSSVRASDAGSRPASGLAAMLRTRSCSSRRKQPAGAQQLGDDLLAVGQGCPGSGGSRARSPRRSRCRPAAASRSAHRPPSVSRPPGRRTRASPPSPAGCMRSTPGHQSGRGRATTADRAARPGSIDSPAYPPGVVVQAATSASPSDVRT